MMNLGDDERLDLLFFELASEDRLNILRELAKASLKMQDVARKLDLTATEASRQLQRMSKAELIERLPEGLYTVTQFGKLILSLSPSLEFVLKYKQYFMSHNVWHVPSSFVSRFGELSQAVLLTEMGEVMIRWEGLIRAAEEHLWVMTPQRIPSLVRLIEERHLQGVKIRYITPEQLSSTYPKALTEHTVERRFFDNFDFGILAAEKEAMLALPFMDGTPNPSGFFGHDSAFLKWVHDLFLYYWDQAKKWISTAK
jgi:predicted transcriptional regulator